MSPFAVPMLMREIGGILLGCRFDAIFLVAEDGSDPPMQEVLGIKASAGRQIVDPDLGVAQVKSDSGGLSRLVKRYLDRRDA